MKFMTMVSSAESNGPPPPARRSSTNPIGGWYGLKKGLRGRFGVYVPPLMEALGLCELEHNQKNNRMRASDLLEREPYVSHYEVLDTRP